MADDAKANDENNDLSFCCSCGSCELKVKDAKKPLFCGFCHCDSCKVATQAPLNHCALFKPENVEFIKGSGKDGAVVNYKVRETRSHTFCGKCGYTLYGTNGSKLISVPVANFAKRGEDQRKDKDYASIPDYFKPQVHLWFSERIGDYYDDPLTKYLDYPQAFGGTGKQFEKEKK